MSATPNTNPYSIGNDCILKYSIGAGGTGTTVLNCRGVTFSDSLENADVTSRGHKWKMQVPTLRTVTVSTELIYDPTNNHFNEIHAAYVGRQRISLTIEDDRENVILSFVAFISKFDLNQNLGEAMSASIEFLPAPGDNA